MTIIGKNVIINYDNIVAIQKYVREIKSMIPASENKYDKLGEVKKIINKKISNYGIKTSLDCRLDYRLELQGIKDLYYTYYDNEQDLNTAYEKILDGIKNNFKIVYI